jgi:hypothetical protein
MGFLDYLLSDPAVLAKQKSINRWRQDIELQHPDELEEQPFTDPNFYSEDEQESNNSSEKQEVAPRREISYDNLQVDDPKLEPLASTSIANYQITTTVPYTYTSMSTDKKFDYGGYKVAYSNWQDPFSSNETQEAYSFTPYAVGAKSKDGEYKRIVQPLRRNIFQVDDSDEDAEDESQSGDESSSICSSNVDEVKLLTHTIDSGSAEATASSHGATGSSTAVSIPELIVCKKPPLIKTGTHATTTTGSRLPVTIRRPGIHGLAFTRDSATRCGRSFTWRAACFVPIAIDTFKEVKRQEKS